MQDYKTSNYNFLFQWEGQEFLFNFFSRALVKIDPESQGIIYEILKNPNLIETNEKRKIREELIKQSFVTLADMDEITILKLRYRFEKYNPNPLNLVILPTLDCNFNCKYCIIGPREEHMTPDVECALSNFVSARVKGVNNFNVTWLWRRTIVKIGCYREAYAKIYRDL
ncbi:MAG: hypothetical protein ACUVQP_08780 [Bacteroidales bacterium]